MTAAQFLPEILLTAMAFVVLVADLLLPLSHKRLLPYLGVVGLGAVILTAVPLAGQHGKLALDIFLLDQYAVFFKVFFPAVGIFTILASIDYVNQHLSSPGEYYGILLLSVLAGMLMTSTGEFLTAYIALELFSFCLYVLVSYAREDARSTEGGIKYILLGALASAMLLYGISYIYGVAGVTTFQGIADKLGQGQGLNPGLLVGLVLLIAGLGFKVAAVPFHMWAPDIYHGAPTPITAYISVASKAAGFALLLRIFAVAFMPAADYWRSALAGLAVITMTVGNLVAIPQRNIKRMLAYSSIGQVGYLLLGMAALSPGLTLVPNGVLLHLAGYAVTNLAAFTCIITYYNLTGKEDIYDYAGMAQRAPQLALVLSVALFSLAGLPFFAGFTTKFYLFTAAAQGGLLWLVLVAVVNSLVSLYYYLVVVRQMYIQPANPEGQRLRVPWLLTATVSLLFLGVVFIGVYPAPLLKAIEAASRALMG